MRTLQKNSDLWYAEYYTEDDVKFCVKVNILYEKQTPFQKLCIMENETFGKIMTLDGYIQVTEKDEFIYHDMIAHVPMAVNPAIENVLIIGGGDGGTAREIARYPGVKKIDMVEIDKEVVQVCQEYFPDLAGALNQDSRIHVMFEDGLVFVKHASDASYDLIIVDSTDPEGPGEGLFTSAFYEDCFRVLSEKGILINQHEGAFYESDKMYMQKAHRKIKKTFPIARVYGFNAPTYASGYWYFGFASKKLDPILDLKKEEWNALNLNTRYYNSEIHAGSFSLPNYVKEILKSV